MTREDAARGDRVLAELAAKGLRLTRLTWTVAVIVMVVSGGSMYGLFALLGMAPYVAGPACVAIDLALTVGLYGSGVMQDLAVRFADVQPVHGAGWDSVLRWFSGAATVGLNVAAPLVESATPGRAGQVHHPLIAAAVHALFPLLLAVLAEYRQYVGRQFAAVAHHIQAAAAAQRARQAEQDRVDQDTQRTRQAAAEQARLDQETAEAAHRREMERITAAAAAERLAADRADAERRAAEARAAVAAAAPPARKASGGGKQAGRTPRAAGKSSTGKPTLDEVATLAAEAFRGRHHRYPSISELEQETQGSASRATCARVLRSVRTGEPAYLELVEEA
jgi:hypothetical protein